MPLLIRDLQAGLLVVLKLLGYYSCIRFWHPGVATCRYGRSVAQAAFTVASVVFMHFLLAGMSLATICWWALLPTHLCSKECLLQIVFGCGLWNQKSKMDYVWQIALTCLLSKLCHFGNREMSWRIKTWCEVYHKWCWQVFVQSLSSGRGCSTYTCCRTTGWMVWHKIKLMSLISHTVGSIVTMSTKHFLWLVI